MSILGLLGRWTLDLLRVAILATLGGCSVVGPEYVKPEPPTAATYLAQPQQSDGGSGPSLHFATNTRPDGQWWRAMHSDALDNVVQQALVGNFDLATARARLQQARELAIALEGNPHPELDLTTALSNRKFNGAQFSSERGSFNIYSVGAQVSYSPDVFGELQRAAEAGAARADYAKYEFGAAYLSVLGNTVQETLTLAELTAERSAIRKKIDVDKERLELAKAQVSANAMPEADLHAVDIQLIQDRSALSRLEQRLGASQNALAVLAGGEPATWAPPEVEIADLRLPHYLPLSVPSRLAHQRPDIEAAEALLRAANADVGIATAQLYPHLVVSASTLFSLGADLSLPLLHWDSLKARKRASDAAYRAAMAHYRETVIRSLFQVATVLRALQYDRSAVASAHAVLQSSAKRLRLLRAERKVGRLARMPLLEAIHEEQTFRVNHIRATVQLFRDVAQFYLAMGGGWEPDSAK